ncbi:MarC family protein [bacterium]|nr:MarC family protein [bacterium]
MLDFLKTIFALFVAMDALGTLPFYFALTHNLDKRERKKIIWEGILTAYLISCTFAFLGKLVFKALGLSMGDFMIAGGLLLLLISVLTFMEILQTQKMQGERLSIVPLGTPLLAGPAVLTTTIMFTTLYGYIITLSALAIVCLFSALIFLLGDNIIELLGEGVLKGISKIACLFLASVAVMLIRKGIEDIIVHFPH